MDKRKKERKKETIVVLEDLDSISGHVVVVGTIVAEKV